jgi:hypothetical protein
MVQSSKMMKKWFVFSGFKCYRSFLRQNSPHIRDPRKKLHRTIYILRREFFYEKLNPSGPQAKLLKKFALGEVQVYFVREKFPS